jgi:hypothetical protein
MAGTWANLKAVSDSNPKTTQITPAGLLSAVWSISQVIQGKMTRVQAGLYCDIRQY